ncbi:hypothetical protein MNBD_GAMMA17-1423 [hydrothermal vent metagenome]|uniref:Uncharacterized protein n=1 Tax=hydrothermal vent metagenome TaxID=652676 RepID=A0A3B0Z2I3_9ZZZZ
MEDDNFEVPIKCLFCGVVLRGPEDAKHESGDLIECQECGEGNDFYSVIDVAKEDATNIVKEKLDKTLEKTIGNLFK